VDTERRLLTEGMGCVIDDEDDDEDEDDEDDEDDDGRRGWPPHL
jgi:hypothetical protein